MLAVSKKFVPLPGAGWGGRLLAAVALPPTWRMPSRDAGGPDLHPKSFGCQERSANQGVREPEKKRWRNTVLPVVLGELILG
jgi:hypothetical protein